MAKIRVVRMLEYTYDDIEAMNYDMSRWTVNTPTVLVRGKMTMKSSVMIPEPVEESNE